MSYEERRAFIADIYNRGYGSVVSIDQFPGDLGVYELTQLLADGGLDKSSARILDAGCGPGRNTMMMARLGWPVTAVDVSSVALDLLDHFARQYGCQDHVLTLCQDILTDPCDGMWAGVVFARMMHHFTPEEVMAIVQSTANRTLIGGYHFLLSYLGVPGMVSEEFADKFLPADPAAFHALYPGWRVVAEGEVFDDCEHHPPLYQLLVQRVA